MSRFEESGENFGGRTASLVVIERQRQGRELELPTFDLVPLASHVALLLPFLNLRKIESRN